MSGSTERQDVVAAVPWPARYWWLKRFALAGMLLILVVTCLRIWWGVVAERRLDAAIAAIVARGEPIFPEDFDQPPIPDEENAATLYKQAAALIVRPNGGFTFVDTLNDLSAAAGRMPEAVKLVEDNEPALQIVREARSMPPSDWGMPRSSLSGRKSSLAPAFNLSDVLCGAAMHRHRVGDDDVAIALLNDAVLLARSMGGTPRSLMAAIGESVAMNRAAQASEFVILDATADGNAASSLQREAIRDGVRRLVDQFLREDRFRDGWRRAQWGERAFQLETVRFTIDDPLAHLGSMGRPTVSAKLFFAVGKALFSPILYLEAVRLMDHASAYAALSSQPNLPAARAIEPEPLECGTLTEWHVRFMSALLMPVYAGTWDREMSDWTYQALVGVAIGVRLYDTDNGRLPESLDELVPTYLPRVPIDLMAANGRQIAYVRDGDKPRVYSVGMNARDDGGQFIKPTRATRRTGQQLPDDLIVYLMGKPITPVASQSSNTQRIEIGDDVERKPRDP